MLTALAVFAAAGAAVALAAHNAGMLRGSLAVVAVAAVPLAAAPWLNGAVRDVRDQSRQARALADVVAPALTTMPRATTSAIGKTTPASYGRCFRPTTSEAIASSATGQVDTSPTRSISRRGARCSSGGWKRSL